MEKIKYLLASPYSQLQNEAIPTLMECFDEWQMFTQMYGFTFPFYEVSFLAIDEDTNKVIAHAGIMPFTMTNSDKKVLKVAGLASVATSPQYRKKGIANKLCTLAKEWAQENNFDLMALYTQFFRVYESCNWSIYNTTSQVYQNPNFNSVVVPALLGSQLTSKQKEIIQTAYNNEEAFTGFVQRNDGDYFHDWNRLFRESFCQWYIKNDSYILAIENVIAEAAGDPKDILTLAQNFPSSFTSKDSKIATILKENNWTNLKLKEEEFPFWHHERVMTLPLTKEGKNATLFFSLSDKF